MATCQELLVLIQQNLAAQLVLDAEVADAQQAADDNENEGIDLAMTYEIQCEMEAVVSEDGTSLMDRARRKIEKLGGPDGVKKYLLEKVALYMSLAGEMK